MDITKHLTGYEKVMDSNHSSGQRLLREEARPGFRTVSQAPPSDKTSTLHFDQIIGGENSVRLRIECRPTLNNEMIFSKANMLLPTAFWILFIAPFFVSYLHTVFYLYFSCNTGFSLLCRDPYTIVVKSTDFEPHTPVCFLVALLLTMRHQASSLCLTFFICKVGCCEK